jgi:hypothetical protein
LARAGVHVSNTVLRVCIGDIRAALGDDVSAPQYAADAAAGGADDEQGIIAVVPVRGTVETEAQIRTFQADIMIAAASEPPRPSQPRPTGLEPRVHHH